VGVRRDEERVGGGDWGGIMKGGEGEEQKRGRRRREVKRSW